MALKFFVLLILPVFASEKNENDTENDPMRNVYGQNSGNHEENSIVVKIEEDEIVKVNKSSKFIGVTYNKNRSMWNVQRWSKNEKKLFFNGCYDDEETAAHASDTLVRKLMTYGELKLKLNFPDDHTEVYPKEKTSISKFIGVSYHENGSKWYARRWSKHENKLLSNGNYDDEETAAHASDTLARKLMANGEQGHKLNFSDGYTDVYPEKKKTMSKYIGVYMKSTSKWVAQRWSKNEKKMVQNGYYDDEEVAARASDTLAREFMANGEQGHKLNFPDDYTEVYPTKNQNKKRKRPKELNLEHLQNN